ncbi:MAG: zinc metalloprotease HtpX [Actinomycetota bacterium]
MSFVLRRSLPSLSGMVALLLAVGFAAVVFLNAPIWFPFIFATGLVFLQYAINPYIIEWLIPASIIEHTETGYRTDHPLGALVEARCRQAGIAPVKLGIVDDGNPNAFTFGRTRGDARMWVTRGLLERLDERELDAVIAHEVGHVRNRDFILMTVAAVVPMILYFVYLVARGANRDEAKAVAIAAYVGYIVARFTLLALSRAREYSADHWSCQATGDGDALCSALVKVAYGMGSVDAARKSEAVAAVGDGKRRRQRVNTRSLRLQSMSAMGIFEPRDAIAMETALAQGLDPQRAIAALRWDMVNPWAKVLEKMSSHPIGAHRFKALEESSLPGKPSRWSVVRGLATVTPEQRFEARAHFGVELALVLAPWVVLIPLVAFGAFRSSPGSIGIALIVAGLLFLVKQFMRYPTKPEKVETVTALLERLDAGPAAGIDVELAGRIIGRGMPGYVLSPDLVLQDESGFVPVLYANPIPFARSLFGLARVQQFLGKQVVARGWYRRLPGPVVELREVRTDDGHLACGYTWVLRYIGSALVILAGFIVLLSGLAH